MPLKQDPEHGGTEADGTKSPRYCSYCYQDGKFTGDFKNRRGDAGVLQSEARRNEVPANRRLALYPRNSEAGAVEGAD